jgi:hypothetical protein
MAPDSHVRGRTSRIEMVAVLVDLAHGCAFGLGARRVASVQRVNATREGFSQAPGDRRLVVLLASESRQQQRHLGSRHPWLEPLEIPRPTRGRGDAAGAAAFTPPGVPLLPCPGRRARSSSPALLPLHASPRGVLPFASRARHRGSVSSHLTLTTCMMIANRGENERVERNRGWWWCVLLRAGGRVAIEACATCGRGTRRGDRDPGVAQSPRRWWPGESKGVRSSSQAGRGQI